MRIRSIVVAIFALGILVARADAGGIHSILGPAIHVQGHAIPVQTGITPQQLNDIRNFATWAKTATVASIQALKGHQGGIGSFAMLLPSVPAGHTLGFCSITDYQQVVPMPFPDITADCLGPDSLVRNQQTQTECRRQGVAAISPILQGYTYVATPGSTSFDVWTRGHTRVFLRCTTTETVYTGTYQAIHPTFGLDLEITSGSQPFLTY
jgi:hypothetical protein